MSYFPVKTREPTRNEEGKPITYKMRRNATESNIEGIKSFFKGPILKNEQLTSGEDGIYTWILKHDGTFYAAKTFTQQEIGTLHVNLFELTKEPTETKEAIDAAGELYLEHGEYGTIHVEYNLLSGTYMAPRFKGQNKEQQMILRRGIESHLDSLFASWGITPVFLHSKKEMSGNKVLETAHIRTTPENIAMLNSMFERSGGARKTRRLQIRGRTLKRRKHRPFKNRF